ncbi:MAG TPA: thermonuclease family protein [Xanthobacteraceae bacterium]|jgi:endonuclease YncB( thermonuclease family)|nr:thermonuclease family protein [Xanthobacteraceae bacterium]
MASERQHTLSVLVAALAAIGLTPAIAQQAATSICGGEETARATVSRIIDGRTFLLDDRREVRLSGIEVPSVSTQDKDAAAARNALVALAQGDEVSLRRAEIPADRYGRIVAYAYTLRDGDELFLQGEMIAAGLARAGDRIGTRNCAAELLNRERGARAAKLGLWADPDYNVLNAETVADVLARRGRFALVEGIVTSVRESGPTIYVNFGRRWSQAFTVTISKRKERNFVAAGVDPKALEGRRVRVRGWVEERGAGGETGVPWIEAAQPEQIEFADRN